MSKIFTAAKMAIQNLFTKPNTILFPGQQVEVPPTIRGVPKVDKEKCTLCMRCDRIGKGEGSISIDIGKCCYCQECEDICNFQAIKLSSDVLTANLDRDLLVTKYEIIKEEE